MRGSLTAPAAASSLACASRRTFSGAYGDVASSVLRPKLPPGGGFSVEVEEDFRPYDRGEGKGK